MTNKEAFSEAKKYIPGGVNSPVRAFGSVGGEPVMIDHAKGAYLYDVEGKKYLDFIQSWGPLIFGHCDKDIEEAIISAVKQGVSYGAPSPKETALAKLICDEFKQIDKIRFVSSGTEATMSAIRVARGYSKKDGLIKFEGCYHGHSDALLIKAGSGATTYGNASSSGVPQDVVKNTYLAVYNDIQSVKAIFENNKDYRVDIDFEKCVFDGETYNDVKVGILIQNTEKTEKYLKKYKYMHLKAGRNLVYDSKNNIYYHDGSWAFNNDKAYPTVFDGK